MKTLLLSLVSSFSLSCAYGQYMPCQTGAVHLRYNIDEVFYDSSSDDDTTLIKFTWHQPNIGLFIDQKGVDFQMDIMLTPIVKLNLEDSLNYSMAD